MKSNWNKSYTGNRSYSVNLAYLKENNIKFKRLTTTKIIIGDYEFNLRTGCFYNKENQLKVGLVNLLKLITKDQENVSRRNTSIAI